MCDDRKIAEAVQKIIRTYDWLYMTTHLLLEFHGTYGHCHKGHGL